MGNLAWFWILRDYEAEAGQWAIAVWEITEEGAPPGAEDEYAICGFMAALVGEMLREGGPEPDSLIESIRGAVSLLSEDLTHPALALCRPLVKIFTGDIDGAIDELEAMADHPHPWPGRRSTSSSRT